MIFPNWKQRAVDKAQRQQAGQSTMRISRVTLKLLEMLRGNTEASDDETVYYLAAESLKKETSCIQRAPQRPINAADAEMRRLPSDRSGS